MKAFFALCLIFSIILDDSVTAASNKIHVLGRTTGLEHLLPVVP